VHVRMVLETLRHHQLFRVGEASKCQFIRSSVGFLGPRTTLGGCKSFEAI
jgi:hypothetical protein